MTNNSTNNHTNLPSSPSVSPTYYKQSKPRNEHLHHRSYAGDAMHNSPGSSSSMRSVSTPADVNNHSQLTTSGINDNKNAVSNLSSPWYPPPNHSPLNARSAVAPPPPPPLRDERSILSRPLTAFLWDNSSKDDKSPTSTPKKDMVILPPLSSKSSSPNNFDRLPPV